MSPKKKANELFDKYYIICQEFTEEIQCSIQAKQCALIAVDEMLKHMSFHFGQIGISTLEYWNQVKQEIQKL